MELTPGEGEGMGWGGGEFWSRGKALSLNVVVYGLSFLVSSPSAVPERVNLLTRRSPCQCSLWRV